MKLFAKLTNAVLTIDTFLPFTILKDESGGTLLSFSDLKLPEFSLPSLPKVPEVDSITDSTDIIGGRGTIYQWHDSEGTIQFTTEIPPPGTEYLVRHFNPDANVIESVEVPPREAPAANSGAEAEIAAQPADPDMNPYSEGVVKKLFEDARNIEKLLNQRFQNQESAINQ